MSVTGFTPTATISFSPSQHKSTKCSKFPLLLNTNSTGFSASTFFPFDFFCAATASLSTLKNRAKKSMNMRSRDRKQRDRIPVSSWPNTKMFHCAKWLCPRHVDPARCSVWHVCLDFWSILGYLCKQISIPRDGIRIFWHRRKQPRVLANSYGWP